MSALILISEGPKRCTISSMYSTLISNSCVSSVLSLGVSFSKTSFCCENWQTSMKWTTICTLKKPNGGVEIISSFGVLGKGRKTFSNLFLLLNYRSHHSGQNAHYEKLDVSPDASYGQNLQIVKL